MLAWKYEKHTNYGFKLPNFNLRVAKISVVHIKYCPVVMSFLLSLTVWENTLCRKEPESLLICGLYIMMRRNGRILSGLTQVRICSDIKHSCNLWTLPNTMNPLIWQDDFWTRRVMVCAAHRPAICPSAQGFEFVSARPWQRWNSSSSCHGFCKGSSLRCLLDSLCLTSRASLVWFFNPRNSKSLLN